MVIGSGAILRNAVGLRDVDAGTVRTSSQCGTAGRSDGWCALLGGLLFPSPSSLVSVSEIRLPDSLEAFFGR